MNRFEQTFINGKINFSSANELNEVKIKDVISINFSIFIMDYYVALKIKFCRHDF